MKCKNLTLVEFDTACGLYLQLHDIGRRIEDREHLDCFDGYLYGLAAARSFTPPIGMYDDMAYNAVVVFLFKGGNSRTERAPSTRSVREYCN